mmetsp:Transcript_7050/g.20646  ORF Transcript_7050/g.20646 Transcript_7050/m.20646 type:complete len:249 (+) Transcript_7050:993-1739(+)
MEAPVVHVTSPSDSPPSASVSWLAGGCAHAGDTAMPLRGGGRGAAPSGRLLGPAPDVQRHAPTRARQSKADARLRLGRRPPASVGDGALASSGDSRREATRGLTARERAPEHNLAGGEADQRLEGCAAEPAAAAAVGRARASARARRRAAPVEVVAQDAVSQLERVRRVRLGASLVKEAERVADVVQHKAGVARRLADAVRARESRRPRDRGFAAERRGTGGGLALSDELPVPSARDAERGSLACHIH